MNRRDYPRLNERVVEACIFCHRQPVGETYGPAPHQWDHTGICPACWDETTKEPEDDDEEALPDPEDDA
jgi:hypothetical protein